MNLAATSRVPYMLRMRMVPLFLACLTLVTSVGLGHARGMLPGESAIVICRGHAAVTIWIDAQGNEVSHGALCPDAALGLLTQGAVGGPGLGPVPGRASLLRSPLAAAPWPLAAPQGPLARGPPRPV